MEIYAISYCYISIQTFLKQNKRNAIWTCGGLLFLILSLRRVDLGVDLPGYERVFNYLSQISLSKILSYVQFLRIEQINEVYNGEFYSFKMEYGYLFLNWLISKMGIGFHGFLVICAIVNIVSFALFFSRYSKSIPLSFLLFFSLGTYIYCFGILRQMLAVSTLLWSVPYIEKGKNIKAILVIMLAFLFHRTAIVFLPLIWLTRIKLTQQKCKTAFLGLVLFGVGCFFVLGKLIPIIYTFLGKTVVVNNLGFSTLDYLLIGVLIYVIIFYDFKKMDDKDNILIWSLIMLIAIRVMCSIEGAIARSEIPYYSLCYALIPNLINRWTGHNRRIIQICLCVFLFCYCMKTMRGTAIVPYIPFWIE